MPNPSNTFDDIEERVPATVADQDAASGARPQEDDAAAPQAAPASDVEAITRERDDFYDRLLRKTAEFDNYRKRIDRERREQADYAASDVLADLLPLVDDLERALQADSQGGVDAYRKGVELIHKQMLDLLKRRGVTPIEAVGQQFDPHVHQAVIHETVAGHDEGEVVEEFRRGYKLRDRLLRPAMVKVAKA